MKKYLLLLFIAVLFGCSSQQIIVNHSRKIDKKDVYGGYKIGRQYSYIVQDGKIEEKELTFSTTIFYNDSGYAISSFFYGSDSSIIDSNFNKLNLKGNKIERLSFNVNRLSNQITRYNYNDFDEISEKIILNYDSSMNRHNVYKYDSIGKIIEETDYIFGLPNYTDKDTSKKIPYYKNSPFNYPDTTYWKYVYNNDGLCSEIKLVKPDGTIKKENFNYFDNQGNVVSQTGFDLLAIPDSNYNFVKSRVHYKSSKKYNKDGQVIENIVMFDDFPDTKEKSLPMKTIYKYDEYGNKIEEINYIGDIPQSFIRFIYSK